MNQETKYVFIRKINLDYKFSFTVLIIISLTLSIFITLIYYPGVLYSDSYVRWNIAHELLSFSSDFNTRYNIFPSIWMAILYSITNNYASYSLFQSFLFFFTTFLLLQEFLLLRGIGLTTTIIAFSMFPLVQGYSVFHETSIGVIIGINILLVLINDKSVRNSNLNFFLWILGLFLGITFIFGFRINSITILPIIIFLIINSYKHNRKYLLATFLIIILTFIFLSLYPFILQLERRDTLAPGLAWEIVQTVKRIDEPQKHEYLNYLGDYQNVNCDVYLHLWGSFYNEFGHADMMLPENGDMIRKDYIRLAVEFPTAYFRNKVYVFSRVLGVKTPLYFWEFYENRYDMLEVYGYRYTNIRHNQFLKINTLMENQKWLSRPIIHFFAILFMLGLSYKTLKKYNYPLVCIATISIFYYSAFLITTPSYEFRYYFPSFYLNLIVTLTLIGILINSISKKMFNQSQ